MELASEEEMASIEAALTAASSSLPSCAAPAIASPSFKRNTRSYESSPSESLSKLVLNTPTNKGSCSVDIQIELVSEDGMASIEAALGATPPSISSIAAPAIASTFPFRGNTRSIPSRTKRRLSFCAISDIEDFGSHSSPMKKSREADSFFHRFRSKTGLYVSDITAADWCEKQVEFVLLSRDRDTSKATAAHGPRQAILEGEEWREERLKSAVRGKLQTTARRAGRSRHKKLAEEVVEEVEFLVKSKEDSWALKLLNFILAAHQLLTEGFTREPLLISFFENIWMVGKVDEIRMPETKTYRNPIILDIKTRERNTLPTEAQKRKNRLQLMCYKYMWDNMVADNFPSKHFFDFFSLSPRSILSDEVRKRAADSGFLVLTLDDMVKLYRSTCRVLPPAHDQLLLRYEYQKDNSLLGEDQFAFDCDWVKSQIRSCLEFWLGEREASYTSQEERWKCRYCKFASSICPANADLE